MKRIIYTDPQSGNLFVVLPAEGARLCNKITLDDGTELSAETVVSADSLARGWPIQGAVADWAEVEDEFVARIAAKDVPQGVSFQIVDEADIPLDRTFRNAWKEGSQGIEHDMVKCREITKDRLRAERAPLLAALDVAFQRALEVNGNTAAIVAEKQRLRDITKLVTASLTLDELKALKA